MAQQLTTSQVLALAPDGASAAAGQGLARPNKWKTIGQSDAALWGELQGSGKDPYRVRVDLTDLAAKCSCPSRKFPCKHALGLMLITAEQPAAVATANPPDWVAEWLAQRSTRKETQAARATEKREVDPQAQAKRAAQRESRVEDGIEELSTWLEDLIRQGLAVAQNRPESHWTAMAAHLVDAQAPGLARLVRRLGETTTSGEGWQSRLLDGAARLHLLCEAHSRLSVLPLEVQADVRAAVGWTTPKEDLLALPRQSDTWSVLAQRVVNEDQLRVQRTWLLGHASGRHALILQFAAGPQAFEQTFRVGAHFPAELVYYPGTLPLRAMLVGERGTPIQPPHPIPPAPPLATALRTYAAALASQPWLELWPMRVGRLTACPTDDPARLELRDEAGRSFPLAHRFAGHWHLAALGGGAPIEVFGEWDGESLRPLSAVADGALFTLGQANATTTLERVA